ncbi:MAG: triose-phosphate isomerase [Alphaproteobacteria bacterium]|nr:triose-phosphate isomerase [Alphaproteobacteria bacterium]
MTRPSLIAGNWKMNGMLADARALAKAIAGGHRPAAGNRSDVVLCPPAPLLLAVGEALAGSAVALGGQDCHAKPSGAFTGDVSARLLADIGCRYVIVGHSERRTLHGESDATVRAKAEAALAAGLIAIICVGETLAEREAGATASVLERQIDGSVPAAAAAATTVVAYEPVWAIGTGKVATTAQVAEAHGGLRRRLARNHADGGEFRLLYGGSVKPDNAGELLALPDVDGALVGGASLDAGQFLAIVAAARG